MENRIDELIKGYESTEFKRMKLHLERLKDDSADYEAQANTYCTQYCWRYSTIGPGATRVTNTTNYICTGDATTTRPVFSVYDDSGS